MIIRASAPPPPIAERPGKAPGQLAAVLGRFDQDRDAERLDPYLEPGIDAVQQQAVFPESFGAPRGQRGRDFGDSVVALVEVPDGLPLASSPITQARSGRRTSATSTSTPAAGPSKPATRWMTGRKIPSRRRRRGHRDADRGR